MFQYFFGPNLSKGMCLNLHDLLPIVLDETYFLYVECALLPLAEDKIDKAEAAVVVGWAVA